MIPTLLFVLYVKMFADINSWTPYGFFTSSESCHAALLSQQAQDKDRDNIIRPSQCIGYEMKQDVHPNE